VERRELKKKEDTTMARVSVSCSCSATFEISSEETYWIRDLLKEWNGVHESHMHAAARPGKIDEENETDGSSKSSTNS